MNKIINGKRYDTEKAELIGDFDNGMYVTDFGYYSETLYRKRTGEFFLHLEGGAQSACAQPDGTGWTWGEQLRPASYEEARAWAESHITADEYAAVFGEPEEDDEAITATFSIAKGSKAKLEREASRTSKTQSAIVEELIEAM